MKVFFLLFFILSCSQLPSKRTDKLSILQGVTTSKEVEFSILTTKDRKLDFELKDIDGNTLKPVEVKMAQRDFSPYVIYKVLFVRDQKKEFNLFAYDKGALIDQRLIGKGQRDPSKLRLVVASCMSDYHSEHFKIWDEIAKKNPEYLLMIGDNVYADVSSSGKSIETNPSILWERYTDARLTFPLFFQEKLIATHAIWDDHDYGINNGGEGYTFKQASKEIFDDYFGQSLSDEDWEKGPGVGGLLSLGDFNLYFLDGRSFRSSRKEGKHLGIDQESWFLNKLKEEITPSFIIKGDQFFGGYHQFESYEGNHPSDFYQLVDRLKASKSPFIFISGDRHMSEIMQFPRSLFGMPSFEITSSPLHSSVYGKSEVHNPWRVVSNEEEVNFTLIQSEAVNDHWFLEVENIGDEGQSFYRRELAVFIKDLQNNLQETRKRRSGKRRYRRIRRRR